MLLRASDTLLQHIDVEKIMAEYLTITGQHRHLIAIECFECGLVIDIAAFDDDFKLIDKWPEFVFHRFT